tara:strand:+ start:559 stop:774 length:216 start_codon:yes stop_codon:yes gene_type:complete
MKTKRTQIVISPKTAEFAANKLSEIFPKREVEPVYSLGFQRWSKLSLTKRKALMILNDFNYQDCINSLQRA